jgi:hypothetical protein
MTGPVVGGRRREEGETDREEDPGAPPECSKGRREAVGQNWPRGAVGGRLIWRFVGGVGGSGKGA